MNLELVKDTDELARNILTFEKCFYTNGSEKGFAYDLVCKGNNFIPYYALNRQIHFVPSRFVGYRDNNSVAHDKAKEKRRVDKVRTVAGGKTDARITKVLECDCRTNDELEARFLEWCNEINIKPHNNDRKYWSIFDLT